MNRRRLSLPVQLIMGVVTMNQRKALLEASVLCVLLAAMLAEAGPIETGRHPHPDKAQVVHEAEHAVDHAWEVYHRAALGGTIASPTVQATIEQHLHEARSLITETQDAAEAGDHVKVERLVGQIKHHVTKAIEGSKESKR